MKASLPEALKNFGLRAVSRSSFFMRFKEWAMTYFRFPKLLKVRLEALPRPASEQKINSEQSKSRIILDCTML